MDIAVLVLGVIVGAYFMFPKFANYVNDFAAFVKTKITK